MTDLTNNAAPQNSALVTLTAEAFKYWMTQAGFEEGNANVNQEVFFLYKGTTYTEENKQITPNWHLTAMTTQRDGGDCRNFHFKIEIAKAASHYWHYVIHRDNGGHYHWVGDPNPQNNQTNEGGGGAAGDLVKLAQNRTVCELLARQKNMDNKFKQKQQRALLKKLEQLIGRFRLNYANNRITKP